MTTILVVEDESAVASVVQKSLAKMGYSVPAIASTGEDAVRIADELRPDLVLMDIGLKGRMDGIKAAEAIRDLYELPVVYLTGYADEERLSRARVTDAYGYILKPFNNNELRSTIEMALYKHQMAQRLKERERWFSTTLHSIGDAVIAADRDGRITFMNPVAEQLTGHPRGTATGKKLPEVYRTVDEETRRELESPVEKALREGVVVGLSEHRVLLSESGAEVPIDDSAAPIKDDKGNIIGVVLVFRDVAERKRLEKRLAITERLASLGTLAAGIAHEINNPLAYVVANVEFCRKAVDRLERDGERGERSSPRIYDEIRAALQEAVEGADRVRRIIADVKAFSRPEGESRSWLDVRDVLESAVKLTSNLIPQRAAIVRDYHDVPPIEANESRLGQLFLNLLVNAAQAIPDGTPGAGAHHIRLVTRTDASGRVAVEVCDSGVGIPPEVLRRIFDPFFSTKPVGVGTGLGLAICHRIVTDLGGEISVESQVGRGSTFKVVLPAAQHDTTEAPVPAPPGSRRHRVLVVDPDMQLARMVQNALGSDHDVTLVPSAREALQRVDAHELFDAIVCELQMPDMSAMELYRALHQFGPDHARRLLFLVDGEDRQPEAAFLQSVPNARLEKPVDPARMREALGELLT